MPDLPNWKHEVLGFDQTATLVPNGQVFLAEDITRAPGRACPTESPSVFDPQAYTFTSSQALTTGRSGHTATLLTVGSVLLIGGINNGVTLSRFPVIVPIECYENRPF